MNLFLMYGGLLMLNISDYKMIRELRENNKEVYALIRRIIDYSLESASHACHDLKNHTALISGYCQLLAMTDPEISRNPYIQKIELSVTNQLQLFEEIAAFRYSFNSGELTEHNLISLLENAANKTIAELGCQPDIISLQINEVCRDFKLKCNSNHIIRALCAILTNSIEACSPDNVRIIIYVDTTDDKLQITISDNGTGFSEEMLKTACEPFKTDKKNHSGLGLATASTVIYKHKGDLQINNTDCGSQVTICFPLQI